uniref:Putative gpi mannosyltransferase n=1 Tax=Ixodes ricinus TaxID=34613 RepID=A0A0K8R4Z8_IXORI
MVLFFSNADLRNSRGQHVCRRRRICDLEKSPIALCLAQMDATVLQSLHQYKRTRNCRRTSSQPPVLAITCSRPSLSSAWPRCNTSSCSRGQTCWPPER